MKTDARERFHYAGIAGAGFAALLLVSGCSPTTSKYPEQVAGSEQHDPFGEEPEAGRGSLFGGITLFGSSDDDDKDSDGQKEAPKQTKTAEAKVVQVASKGEPVKPSVNPILWQATLDTLEFVPLLSADPISGVVISDWHASPKNPNERFKIQARILAKELRADAIRVQVFRQERDASLGWVETEVNPQTRLKIEDAILTQAREIRIKKLDD